MIWVGETECLKDFGYILKRNSLCGSNTRLFALAPRDSTTPQYRHALPINKTSTKFRELFCSMGLVLGIHFNYPWAGFFGVRALNPKPVSFQPAPQP